MNEIFVCAECGSENVEMLAWVDLNTRKFSSNVDPYEMEEQYFCLDCKNKVEIIEKEYFDQQ